MTRHVAVLLKEVLEYLKPRSGERYLDGTIGGGGHSLAILHASRPDGLVLGLDRDPEVIENLTQEVISTEPNVTLRAASYKDTRDVLDEVGWPSVHGAILDLGLSSMQLDDPARGLSFMHEGPLDLRFDQTHGQTASELLRRWSETQLANILFEYGELQRTHQLARRIKAFGPIATTTDLIRASGLAHPRRLAQLFQALRLATNDELATLDTGLQEIWSVLENSGHLAVISFHSLEDRIVKHFFRHKAQLKLGMILTKKPVIPTSAEQKDNPRSRSAKLRVIQKLVPSIHD
jgi:16S rRNA (cytosine1402-N4)-methyltransferase